MPIRDRAHRPRSDMRDDALTIRRSTKGSMSGESDGPATATLLEGVPEPLRRATLVTATCIGLSACAVLVFGLKPGIATLFFLDDLRALTALIVILLAVAFGRFPAILAGWARPVAYRRETIFLIAALAGVIGLAGTYLICSNYPLSYDEVMAGFDAAIIRSGHLIAPLRLEWQGYQRALATSFLLPVPGEVAWVSSYLPVNASLRALVGSVATPVLTGPLLLVVAVLALNGIARRLWPGRPDAALVAILLLVTAPQILITAMTPYAMTAHLAFNLVWLWLFLRGGALGHIGAASVGVLACGLHQIVFHPLFAGPFLALTLLQRRWRLAAFYLGVYTAGGIGWILYWQALVVFTGADSGGTAAVGAGWFLQRVTVLLAAFDPNSLDLMTKNLLRFVAWQNPLLLPLAGLAWLALRRGEQLVWALAAGIGLTLLAVTVLLPFQGHGWGYRYLHGVIGSACLLAGRGWIAVTERATDAQAAAARGALAGSCLAAVLILLPMRAVDVHGFMAPYVAASRAIGSADADIVAVQAGGTFYGRDLVRNDPFLRNRPILVLLDDLDAAHRNALCARGKIVVFGPPEAEAFGIAGNPAGAAPIELACSAGRVTPP